MRWSAFVRPGDWAVAAAGAALVGISFPLAWQAGVAEKAIVRAGGAVFAELELGREQRIEVPGPLGTTTIAVERHRVRVVSDPGPRQYCVRQGWLERPGEIAICAPNQVSVQVKGSREAYDSLSY